MLPSTFSHLCKAVDAATGEHFLPKASNEHTVSSWYTAVLHKNVAMQVRGKENTEDYFPKSAAEEYTLNFIKPTWEMQPQPKQPFSFQGVLSTVP